MMKELGKEKKPQKRDIDSEYPTWPWVDYKFQDAKFFEDVRKLLTLVLNPKWDIINVHTL
jgi:hypothetical protein